MDEGNQQTNTKDVRNKRSVNWLHFNDKIDYLYEKLFNKNIKLLAKAFSETNIDKQKLDVKIKSMKNWIDKEVSRPNKFYLSKFEIGKYRLNGEALFTDDSFKSCDIETFKKRVDEYLSLKTSNTQMYIYFFSLKENKILYHTLSCNLVNHGKCSLKLGNTENITYNGEYIENKNHIFLNFDSSYDGRYYMFNKFEIRNCDFKILGVGLYLDFVIQAPRSSLVLLSTSKLTKEEEIKYQYKLNESNILIAQQLPRNFEFENDYILDKLKGEWYHYFYGSREDEGEIKFWETTLVIHSQNEVKYFLKELEIRKGNFFINGNQIVIILIDKKTNDSILIIFEYSDIEYDIFLVKMIDKQYRQNLDMFTIGLFSKKELAKDKVLNVLKEVDDVRLLEKPNIQKRLNDLLIEIKGYYG